MIGARNRLRCLAVSLTLACARDEPAPVVVAAPPPASDPFAACLTEADALDELDRPVARALCSEVRAHEVPGASIAIATGGVVRMRFATGVRCLGDAARVGPDTAFRIGSLSKAITAALAHALLADDRTALDRPLDAERGARLGAPPGFAPTLRQLLDHTAGIPDVLPDASMRARTPAEQIRALLGTPEVPPGQRWRYANGGYALAGAWLAELGGAPWSSLVRTHVLAPLRMDDARTQPPPGRSEDVACGHVREPGGLRAYDVATDYDRFAHGVEAAAPAGAILASAEDLLRFADAVGERAPPGTPSWTRALLGDVRDRAVATGRAPGQRYADGLVVEQLPDGEILLRHAGATGDFTAELLWLPARGFAVAVLSNSAAPLRATLAAALQRAGIDPHLAG